MFRPLMLAIFRLYIDLSSSYTTDTTYVGCFFRCGKRVLCGTEISFMSVVGVWSETVSLVYSLFIVRRTQHCGVKLSYTTFNKATCFNPLGSSSGL